MRYCVIINPFSRGGASAGLAQASVDALSRRERHVDTAIVRSFDDAYSFSREANLLGYDAVVAIGGDGTINKVLNGFYNEDGELISSAGFGVVHTGTSPDFCKSYGIPLQARRAVAALSHRQRRRIPVGMIRFPAAVDEQGRALPRTGRSTEYFACCANIGLGASLARQANTGIRRRFGDMGGTLLSLLRILLSYRSDEYTLRIDGEQRRYSDVYNIAVGITPYIASGIRISPDMLYGERRLYVLLLQNLGLYNVLPMLYKIYSGKPFRNTSYLSLSECTELTIPERHRQNDVEHDGDACGALPCSIRMAADDIPLIQ